MQLLTKMKQLQNFSLQTFRSLFVVHTTEHLDTRTSKKDVISLDVQKRSYLIACLNKNAIN
jgi:hypothetical protein